MTWCTRVKIAVVAPIPRARVIKAVAVNPGAFLMRRAASRKSASMRPPGRLSYDEFPVIQGCNGLRPTLGDCGLDARRARRLVEIQGLRTGEPGNVIRHRKEGREVASRLAKAKVGPP